VFPGWWALLPAVGSALLLYATGTEGNPVQKMLSVAPLRVIGQSSYSAYLWHWPLVVYYRLSVVGRAFTPLEVLVLTALSLGLGWLSWWLIEERTRYVKWSPRTTLAVTVVGLLLLALAPRHININKGLVNRLEPEVLALVDVAHMGRFDCPFRADLPGFPNACVLGAKWETAQVRGVLWGDSHSDHFAPVVNQAALGLGIAIAHVPRTCPPYADSEVVSATARRRNFMETCTQKRRAMLEWLNADPDVELVIMAAAWTGYLKGLALPGQEKSGSMEAGYPLMQLGMETVLGELSLEGRNVLLLADVPRPNRNLNGCVARNMTRMLVQPCQQETGFLAASQIREWHDGTNQVLVNVAAAYPEVTALLPNVTMCGTAQCSTYVNGEFIYRDNNHIRRNILPGTARQIAETIGLVEYLEGLER